MGEQAVRETQADVVIIGGGPAGLAAALCLGRARRRVVVLDAGGPRHAVAQGVHNLLTREGIAPAELRRVAWEQMAQYASVRRVEGRAVGMTRVGERWSVQVEGGARLEGRAVLLATGMIDEHPTIEGYAERWGQSIFLCPFCHGWEVRDQPLAVLGADARAVHLGRLLRGWSEDVVVCTGGEAMGEEAWAELEAAGVPVHTQPVVRLRGAGRTLEAIDLADGTTLERRGLFVTVRQRQVPLIEELDVVAEDEPFVAVDAQLRTALPMVWAAGDVTSKMQQVSMSMAQGNMAGALIASALIMG